MCDNTAFDALLAGRIASKNSVAPALLSSLGRATRSAMLIRPSRVAATSLKVLPRKGLSRALGRLARVNAPQAVLRAAMQAYCSAYRVDLSECEVPTAGFESFDAFF